MSPRHSSIWQLFVVYPFPRPLHAAARNALLLLNAELSSDALEETSADLILEANLAIASRSPLPVRFACAPCLEGISTASALGSKLGAGGGRPAKLCLSNLPFFFVSPFSCSSQLFRVLAG